MKQEETILIFLQFESPLKYCYCCLGLGAKEK